MSELKINCTAIFPEPFVVVLVEYTFDEASKKTITGLLNKFESVQVIEMDVNNLKSLIINENSTFSHQSVIHLADKSDLKDAAQLAAQHNQLYHNCPNIFWGIHDDVITSTIVQTFLGMDLAFLKQNHASFSELMHRIIYREYDDQPIEKNDLKDIVFKTPISFSRHQIFKNQQYQRDFDTYGLVKIPFLDRDTVMEIRAFFESIDHEIHQGFFTTTWSGSLETRLSVNRFIKNIFQPRIEAILTDYEFFYGNFFVKNPSENGDCLPHQDWSTVDEEQYVALTLWCALEDMTPHNGNLRYLPNSHLLKNYWRGRHMPVYFEQYKMWMHKYLMKDIPMQAGDLLLFNQRLIHGSQNNQSGRLRLACGGVVVPKNVPVIHHVGDASGKSSKVRIVDASNDLYSKYDTFDPMEDAYSLSEYELTPKEMNWRELIKILW